MRRPVASWKGTLKAGAVCDAPISALDLFPTAVSVAEAKIPASLHLDGVDILPYLTQASDKQPRERLYWRSVRMGTWAVREGNWKLVHARKDNTMLFDLSADMIESNDVATGHPEIVKRLSEEYASWNKQNVPPLWGPPRPSPRPASRPAARPPKEPGQREGAR
jgi:arylsulfatase A-like enzyme